MKSLLIKRGDIIREFGISDYLMRAINRSGTLKTVKVKGYRCRLYRRSEVEKFILGQNTEDSRQKEKKT